VKNITQNELSMAAFLRYDVYIASLSLKDAIALKNSSFYIDSNGLTRPTAHPSVLLPLSEPLASTFIPYM